MHELNSIQFTLFHLERLHTQCCAHTLSVHTAKTFTTWDCTNTFRLQKSVFVTYLNFKVTVVSKTTTKPNYT